MIDIRRIADTLLAQHSRDRLVETVRENWVSRFVRSRPELDSRLLRRFDIQRAKCEDPKVISVVPLVPPIAMSIEPLLVERYATKRIGWTCSSLFFYGRYLYEYVEYCHIPPPLPTSHDPMIRQLAISLNVSI